MARVVDLAALLDLERVAAVVGERLVDGPGEGATSAGTNGADGVEVAGGALAEDEGGRGVLGGVGDGVALAGLNTRGRVGVDGDSKGRGDEGSARNDNLEETHVGSC